MTKPELNIAEMEKRWLKYWEKEKVYAFNSKSKKKIYSIDTPPPYISGNMHIGHAFSYSQEDFIARYKRMKGFEVFYPFGTDDNGLPTERWIERTRGIKSKEMQRDEFIKIGLELLKEKTPELMQDWINLGISCDFGIYYSTIDDNTRKISQKSFIDLYKKGLIYRDDFPTIFCPTCQTPVAQAELEDVNLKSYFTTVKFGIVGNDPENRKFSGPSTSGNRKEVAGLPIATTRPELLGACVAVFVNPDDKRYKKLIGKKARVPLFGHEVEIIADKSADLEKGTGVLMVCSYGDKYDVDAIKRNNLTPRVIFGNDGKIKSGQYAGLWIKGARKAILEDLKKEGLIIDQKEIEHVVNTHDKCGTEIEYLPVEQWFVKILHKKSELIRQGKKVKWYPEFMFKRYENWVKGLEWDWSISRDRHFGIPLPIWYCKKCDWVTLADEKELPVDPLTVKKKCAKCKSDTVGESKVLDTWATSSLTPQIASSLVGGEVKIPYSLRPQGHDIIRTWAFYTIVKSYLHENKIPWNDIAISGFVTLGGKKMSKSKGGAISPQEVMGEFGSDALRYWAASSKLGDDLDYMEKDLVAGKKFVIKILNASNFVFMNLKYSGKKPAKMVETDRLFLSRLNKMIERATKDFDGYNYSRVKQEVDNFFWRVFADNYLEIVKNRVYNGNAMEKASAFYSLYSGLLALLKMYAPFVPFVSEEIYQNHFKKFEKGKSVHLEEWPRKIGIKELRHDDKEWDKLVEVISKVRGAKSEGKVAMNTPIVLNLDKNDFDLLEKVRDDLQSVTCASEIKQGKFEVMFV